MTDETEEARASRAARRGRQPARRASTSGSPRSVDGGAAQRPARVLRLLLGDAAAAVQLGVFVIPAAFLPLVMNTGNLFRYGVYTLVYATLALGLNVTVGYAGLLDLGYVAFFGFGAYFVRHPRLGPVRQSLARPRRRSR